MSSSMPLGPWAETRVCEILPPTVRSTLVTRPFEAQLVAGDDRLLGLRQELADVEVLVGWLGVAGPPAGGAAIDGPGEHEQVREVDQLALMALGLGRLGEQLDPADRVLEPRDADLGEVARGRPRRRGRGS